MDPTLITSSLLVLRSIGSEPPLIKGRIPILGVAFEWFYEPGAFLESIRKRNGWIYTLYMAGLIGITQVLTQGRVFSAPIFFAFLNKQLFGFSDATMDDNRFRDALNTKLSKMSQIVELLTATYRGFVDETSGYNMYTASATALFGPSFPIQKTFEPYIVFEENLLSYIRKVPRFLNPSGYNARDRTLEIIGQFFTDDEKVAKSSELVRELREVFQRPEYGYTRPEDFAGYFLSIVFASKSNSVPAAFWYIAHIVSDVELKTEVENIIAANYNKATGSFDWDELCRDELLVSCFKETARLMSNVTSGRYVTQDTILKVAADPLNTGSDWKKSVKEYELHKGDSVLVIGNLIHWDPQAYPEPMRWIGKRFLEENKGKLVMHADEWRSYLPWGGGGHMCPGRHLALVEAVVQCVYILWYFDVEPIDKLPSMFIKHKYGTGVIRPDKPFNVTFKRRTIPLQ
ncbi:cytochrome P450 [Lipomyces doorenjongii]|uniref:cytochrome P450 n=1 Tax=Lipomyces doorenjongii TaxID=383834 RepID=UPI0034CF0540